MTNQLVPTSPVYQDCDLEQASTDVDCVEYWEIPCAEPEYECFKIVVEASCTNGDSDCYVGFLRGMCSVF